jgi:hypothetical protein
MFWRIRRFFWRRVTTKRLISELMARGYTEITVKTFHDGKTYEYKCIGLEEPIE